jgi:hypothetical protein
MKKSPSIAVRSSPYEQPETVQAPGRDTEKCARSDSEQAPAPDTAPPADTGGRSS